MAPRSSLAQLETLVLNRRLDEALDVALGILRAINARHGRLRDADLAEFGKARSEDDIGLAFCTRFCAALGAIVTDPAFSFSPVICERLLFHHRWIDLMFSLSGFRSSQHLLPSLSTSGPGGGLRFQGANFLRLLTILPVNVMDVDLDGFWGVNKRAAAAAFLQYISSRQLLVPHAYQLRERLLEWLPDKLDEVRVSTAVLMRLPSIYMHCSYASTPKKHRIKRALMHQMRRACLEAGCPEGASNLPDEIPERPTVFVVCEVFPVLHSMYRTHSLAVKSLREKFHVVGVLYRHHRSPQVDELFDEVITFPSKDFMEVNRTIAAEIVRRNPVLVLYPSLGMAPHPIALASLRLAPVQCVSFGHAASTMCETIDYMVLPEDFEGAKERYSEQVIALPKRAMPFVRRKIPDAPSPRPERPEGAPVGVAIAASMMKLNPRFFDTLAAIKDRAKTPVEFRFFPLAANGLPYLELKRVLAQRLPNARAFKEAPHDVYVGMLRECDLFLSPFPYGNTNSIVDALQVGLPGVCLDGPEPHAHIDAGLFDRIGFPKETIANSIPEYIDAAAKMIDDAAWRKQCGEIAVNCDLDRAFFEGDARLFCDAIARLVWPVSAIKAA